MIDTIKTIISLVVAILPFVLLCFVSKKNNLKKPERSKQFFMPIFAVIFSIVVYILLNHVNTWILNLINSIPRWILALAQMSWMPAIIANILTSIANLVTNLLNSLNMGFWLFFISNIVIILAYLFLKKIIISFMSKLIKNDSPLHTKVAGWFYDYFVEKDTWCIKPEYVHARRFLKTFYITSIVLSSILMLVTSYLYRNQLLEVVFYPVFGILIVSELYFYIDGLTKREFSEDVLGEDEEAYKVVNYSLLRKFLRGLFGNKLLAERTSVNSTMTNGLTNDEVIRKYETSEDPKISTFASYIRKLNANGFELDHNYLKSSVDLLNGKSILFNNPFYSDLIPYAFYPINRTLLGHGKVLVVLGRHSTEEDVIRWISDGIEAVTGIPYMWKVGVLNHDPQDLDIGIISRSDVLDIRLHDENAEFLENVEFMVILEPTKLLSTAQIGLNLLVKKCRADDKNIVYCLCDKNCDGLIDAMSHALMTSITEVSATEKHHGTSSYMCWETDEEYLHHRIVPNISRYLGVGTELAFASLKNQVSEVNWYGGETFPVTDINWVGKQYYHELMNYAGLPTSQEVMDECYKTSLNYWSAGVRKNNCFIVEDESSNMFEVLREFATRSKEQGFINVISTEYLLKDYMADNATVFETDPKAIPYIAADYARTARNTILRLVLLMATHHMSIDALKKELSIIGIKVYDIEKQLWYELYKCYADVSELVNLPDKYEDAVEAVAERKINFDGEIAEGVGVEIFKSRDHYNLKLAKVEKVYYINNELFISACVSKLKSATYIFEDENGDKYYLGAELCGQIYQKYLPGQFFTFGGKYYEMLYLTADGQALVRRAADHINGRPSYRQIREYEILGTNPSKVIGAEKDVSGMKIVREHADIRVETAGYYRMERHSDFANAKKVVLTGEHSKIPSRTYHNKEILRIELPEVDGAVSDNIRYTICVIFNEVFKTLFAENQAYIVATTAIPESAEADQPLTYALKGEGLKGENSIYIIEDSQLDLGLTVAVERNLERIFEIVHDYLDWHREILAESLEEPEEEPLPPEIPEEKKKKGLFGAVSNLFGKIRGMFGKKKKSDGEGTEDSESDGDETLGKLKKKKLKKEKKEKKKRDKKRKGKTGEETPEGEDIPEGDDTPSEDETPEGEDIPEGDDTPSEDETPEGEDTPEKSKRPKKKWGLFGRKKKKKGVTDDETPEGTDGDTPSEDETPEGEDTPEKSKRPKKKWGLFGRKKKKKGATDDETPEETDGDTPSEDETPEEPSEGDEDGDELANEASFELPLKNCPPPEMDEEEFEPEIETSDDETDEEEKKYNFERKPYHERYYLLFGGEEEPETLDVDGTLEYLTALGFANNSLKQVREGKDIAKYIEATFVPNKANARYCDFCGTEIMGAEYEVLADGRERCINCSRTAVKTEAEFKKLFDDVKRNMESFFGISIFAGVKVRMVNSKKLHKAIRKSFVPTAGVDGRVLGVAIKDKNGYSLLVENGSPRMAAMMTMAHELTHIWQYLNWDRKAITKLYGKKNVLQVYEGMAMWAEIQFAYLINEPASAKREELTTEYRQDEYGHGFIRFKAAYPLCEGTVLTRATPFMDTATPIAPEYILCDVEGLKNSKPKSEIEEDSKTYIRNRKKKKPTGESNRKPGNVRMYCFELLDDAKKEIYTKIYEALMSFEPEVSGFVGNFTKEDIFEIQQFVYDDHPEIFWNSGWMKVTFRSDQYVDKIILNYSITKEEAEGRLNEITTAIEPFMKSVDSSMSDYEVALRAYENIISLIDYDSLGLDEQKQDAGRYDKPDDLRSIYGVFVNKKAVCAGYAKALQFILNTLGIECAYITSDTHAWNLIKLEGDYYHVDVTWGDASNTDSSKNYGDAINYSYFCFTTDELNKLPSHTVEAKYCAPKCVATKCNYYVRNGLYFETYDINKVREAFVKNVDDEHLQLQFKCSTAELANQMIKQLISASAIVGVIEYYNSLTGAKIDKRTTGSIRGNVVTINLRKN